VFYHASNVGDLKVLKPHVSNHGEPLVYFSSKRENVLVYLCNAVEKYIYEKYGRPMKIYEKWASYGITDDGRVRIEEYYPNATKETFEGVSGYIYSVDNLDNAKPLRGIKDAFVISHQVEIDGSEFVQDVYAEMLKAESEGKIVIERFEDITQQKKEWIKKTIRNEYKSTDNDDYKEFLSAKFDFL